MILDVRNELILCVSAITSRCEGFVFGAWVGPRDCMVCINMKLTYARILVGTPRNSYPVAGTQMEESVTLTLTYWNNGTY